MQDVVKQAVSEHIFELKIILQLNLIVVIEIIVMI